MRNDLEPYFSKDVYLVGPYTAIIVRKAGQHRALISIKSAQRAPLHQATQMMTKWLEQSTRQNRIRFAIDVDPLETY
jgi:primosomal protein N' (replication factor Y)